MKIQSLSIAVPAGCGNHCKFCVAHIHRGHYTNQIEKNVRFFDLYEHDYINRLAYARDNGCNSVMLTGDGEPLMNRNFLKFFSNCNRLLEMPFRQIELQTSGMLLDDEYLRFLRNTVGVSIISLSLSSLISDQNRNYNCPKDEKYVVDIEKLCDEIKRYDFSLRLSLNLTDYFNNLSVDSIFGIAKSYGADQITFRELYTSGKYTEEDVWISKHSCDDNVIGDIGVYIERNGRPLNKLPFGAVKYSVNDMTVVLDKDCMAKDVSENLKYIILREDCKLYSHWDDKGSLIF